MALVSITSTNCFSARPPLEGKVRLPLTNKKPDPVTCRIGKMDEVRPTPYFGRKSFPPGFTFGAASSAYQVYSVSRTYPQRSTHSMHKRHTINNDVILNIPSGRRRS